MSYETTRRLLHRTATRGGVVSAGALLVMLAGGSLALAGTDDTSHASGSSGIVRGLVSGAVSGAVDGVDATLGTDVSGLLTPGTPGQQPAPQPAPAPVANVGTAVAKTAAAGEQAVSDTLQAVTEPAPGAPPAVDPPAGQPGTKPGTSGTHTSQVTHHAKAGHHATAGMAKAGRHTRGPGYAARLRADALNNAGNRGEFAGQQTNASITPGLSPNSLNSVFGVPDLGGHGVPSVLMLIATVAVAALGAAHLGHWYNRRVVEPV